MYLEELTGKITLENLEIDLQCAGQMQCHGSFRNRV